MHCGAGRKKKSINRRFQSCSDFPGFLRAAPMLSLRKSRVAALTSRYDCADQNRGAGAGAARASYFCCQTGIASPSHEQKQQEVWYGSLWY